ncbi:MAG: hypothetical protein FWH37_07710 [Candidatus Bathyarchaeota archaeon]|nr:hypothetical protein [Candidatus Termiticorpusculum sp.]
MPVLAFRACNVEVESFYFGVSFGGEFAEDALPLIDKVKVYSNFFIVNSWSVATNQTALDLVCNYAADSGLCFIVFFDFISRVTFPWHQQWLDEAPQRWGDKFLGVYLNDEHGERQIDKLRHFSNATDYADAARQFVHNVQYGSPDNPATSMLDAKVRGIQLFTADQMLHWWVYLAGYDVVFTELGWNETDSRQIALGRGAATVQGKDWGAIITWEGDLPPYLGDAAKMYQHMVDSYRAGAKYVVVFNYPTYPDDNSLGILSEDQFGVMEKFWRYTQLYPRYSVVKVDTVLVLPQNYGWGMRRSDHIVNDPIWGIWFEDEKAVQVLKNVCWFEVNQNVQYDIVYEDPRFDYSKMYLNVIYWNDTLPII